MRYSIDKNLESRIDRDRYIGKEFTTNKGYKYIVVGVWEHSPIGHKKRYVIEFLHNREQKICYSSVINSGEIACTPEPNKQNNIKTILLTSDIHFCYQDNDILNILYQITTEYKDQIDEFVDLGDGINNNALSKFIDIEPEKFTLAQELSKYEEHIKYMRFLLPKSKFVILEDNHYHLRKEKYIAENPMLAGLLPDIGLLFDEIIPHAIPYQPFDQHRFGLIHGINYGKFFTKQNLELYGMDIICGHTHTMQSYVSSSGRDLRPPLRSYGIPCMSKRQRYVQGRPTRQVGGFAVLTYDTITTNYNIEYVLVEDKRAIFRGKIYESTI